MTTPSTVEFLARRHWADIVRQSSGGIARRVNEDLGVRWYRKRGHPRSRGGPDTGHQTRAERLVRCWADGIESGRIR